MSQASKRPADVAFTDQDQSKEPTRKKQRHKKHRGDKAKNSSPDAPTKALPIDLVTTGNPASGTPSSSNIEVTSHSFGSRPETTKAEKKRKKHEKQSKARKARPEQAEPTVTAPKAMILTRDSKNQRRQEVKYKKTSKNRDLAGGYKESSWTLTRGVGGIFIEHDPVLSVDEQYLILPTANDVQVYSTTTSLLVRSLYNKQLRNITSCALSKSSPSKLFIGTSDGMLSIWDWTQGRKSNSWQLDISIAQVLSIESTSHNEHVLVLHQGADMLGTITAYELDASILKPVRSQTLLRRRPLFGPIKFFELSGLIVAHSAENLLIGHAPAFPTSDLCEATFTWRDMATGGDILSFDAKVGGKIEHASKRAPAVDIVLGLRTGQILLYEDILFKLIGKEKGRLVGEISVRSLHWHRNAVNTVKWSKDGNYVVSGGSETVLVIWQLDTNQQQFLPHLSTSILSLVVSRSGSSYAVRLGDNSVMILATADLLPTTNITGVAVNHTLQVGMPAVLHPLTPDQLLVAVPGNAVEHQNPQGKHPTMLQTFDFARNLQVSRQAMTRNIITTVNHGPEGDLLDEPSILYMQITHDGKWLATFDTWSPSQNSLDTLYLQQEDDRRNQIQTCLRFWGYNEQFQTWELVTRIDNPHGHNVVLDMKAHPTKIGFATIGADATLRTWSPKARLRDGVRITNQLGNQLYTWSCSSTFSGRESNTAEQSDVCVSAVLAYSDDGSVCAISYSPTAGVTRYVDLLDVQGGTIHSSVPNLLTSGDANIAFHGRYLLCLSQTFSIFDLVSMQSIFSTNIFSSSQNPSRKQFLATNKLGGTFAIAINQENLPKARVAVFNIQNLDDGPVFQGLVEGRISALLSSQSNSGYVVIDSRSQIRQVRAPGLHRSISGLNDSKVTDEVRSLSGIFGTTSATENVTRTTEVPLITDTSVSAPKVLEDILNFSSSAEAPPVGELFNKIASIFAHATTVT